MERISPRRGRKLVNGREFLAGNESGLIISTPTPEYTAVMLTLPSTTGILVVKTQYAVIPEGPYIEEVVVTAPLRDIDKVKDTFDYAVSSAWYMIHKRESHKTLTAEETSFLDLYDSMFKKVRWDLAAEREKGVTRTKGPQSRVLRRVA